MLSCLQEISNSFEDLSVTSTYHSLADNLLRSFVKTFQDTVPQFIAENNTQVCYLVFLDEEVFGCFLKSCFLVDFFCVCYLFWKPSACFFLHLRISGFSERVVDFWEACIFIAMISFFSNCES